MFIVIDDNIIHAFYLRTSITLSKLKIFLSHFDLGASHVCRSHWYPNGICKKQGLESACTAIGPRKVSVVLEL